MLTTAPSLEVAREFEQSRVVVKCRMRWLFLIILLSPFPSGATGVKKVPPQALARRARH